MNRLVSVVVTLAVKRRFGLFAGCAKRKWLSSAISHCGW